MRVLFIGEATVSDEIRCKLPLQHLAKMGFEPGYQQIGYTDSKPAPIEGIDVAIFSRPHHDSLIATYQRLGVPVIVDIDDDFEAIPESHPGYNFVGAGDPYYLNKWLNCIHMADLLIVASEELKKRYEVMNTRCKVIPNGWSADHMSWLVKRNIHKDKLMIGWGGTITHREDFRPCISPIKKILREYPETMVFIAGDYEIYKHFINVAEDRKMFCPMVSYAVYPSMLSMYDILLAPLEDNHFNRAKSDIKLVDACAKGIPFVASNVPTYASDKWDQCGIRVEKDGWYNALESLVVDKQLRKSYITNGKAAVKDREMSILAKKWKEAIEEVL